jgi:hypothetical protein
VGATIHEVDSRHVPMLSNPKLVIDVIRAACKRLTVDGAVGEPVYEKVEG